ncbi:MAG: hypothetical protein ACJ8I9_08060 [Chthoniobacterales bacterium]
MPIAFALGNRTRRFAAAILCLILATVIFAEARRAQHERETRFVMADLNALPPVPGSYATEVKTSSAHNGDDAWKAFCYRERENLIAEAHASSQQ